MNTLTQRHRQRMTALRRKFAVFAMDNRWITVKPNGPDNKGAPVQIDDQGRVVKGMGGKFNGEKISEVRKDFSGPKTPKEGRKAESPSAGLSEAHRSQIDPAKPKGDGITPEMIRAEGRKRDLVQAIKTRMQSQVERVKNGAGANPELTARAESVAKRYAELAEKQEAGFFAGHRDVGAAMTALNATPEGQKLLAEMQGKSSSGGSPTASAATKIDSPSVGVFNNAKLQKEQAFERLKSVRQQVKNGSANQLDLLKADMAHKDAVRNFEAAKHHLQQEASKKDAQQVPESKPFDPKATTGIRKEDIARATAENEVAGFGAVGHANNGKSYIEIDPNNATVGAKAVIFAPEFQGRSGPATGTYKKLDTGMVITGVGQTYSTANGPRVRAYLSKPGEEAKPAPGPLMGTLPKPVAIMRETDKAYGVSNPAYEEAKALHEYGGDMEVMRRGSPAARTAWREKKSLIWVPKSQATASGGEIISMSEWFANREGFSTNEASERRDRAYEDGKARYAALIEQAKAAGVRGVRVGMKAETIRQKLRDAGHQTDSMDGRITDRQMARIRALATRMKQ